MSLSSVSSGAAIKVFFEQAKTVLLRKSELEEARRQIYEELARYFADIGKSSMIAA